MSALAVYLYVAGMMAVTFVILDAPDLRPMRAILFLILWPVAIPFVIVSAFVQGFKK